MSIGSLLQQRVPVRMKDANWLIGGGMLSKALKLGKKIQQAREERTGQVAESVLSYAREAEGHFRLWGAAGCRSYCVRRVQWAACN
jgi:hypothetical protein